MAGDDGELRATNSITSLTKSVSTVRTQPRPSAIRSVLTAPPWAQDEPPSPQEETFLSTTDLTRTSQSRPSIASTSHRTLSPGLPPESNSHWGTFIRPEQRQPVQPQPPQPPPPPSVVQTPGRIAWALKERSKSWLTPANRRSQEGSPATVRQGKDGELLPSLSRRRDNTMGLSLQLPVPDQAFTVAQTQTPGWSSPWTARPYNGLGDGLPQTDDSDSVDSRGNLPNDKPQSRRKRWRKFILTNAYVPLLFRVINLSFTTAALVMAVRIRMIEQTHHVMGVIGSSPTLVIIFAPLTLVHVMSAIYLEYLGRPLGLWRTSAKLAHTLFEIVFICAWSSALSLSFDNYFTSLIPCAAESRISWYNEIPRPTSNLPELGRGQGGVGDRICDDQVILISVVGVGLAVYCINLVISLYRIFEKVKPRAQSFNYAGT